MNRIREASVLGVFLVLASVFGGWILGAQIKSLKLGDRYVSVRGLAERTVKSDLAIWTLSTSVSGDDYASVLQTARENQGKIGAFLSRQGIPGTEIAVNAPSISDRRTQPYETNTKGPRYVLTQQFMVTSSRVDGIKTSADHVADLMQEGVLLDANTVQFKFSSLNSIKPDMISEATRNARQAAERFASDSGSHVGMIRQAKQGIFSIAAPNDTGTNDPNDPSAEGGADNADSSIMKKVRVVTSVDYYLEK